MNLHVLRKEGSTGPAFLGITASKPSHEFIRGVINNERLVISVTQISPLGTGIGLV